MFQLERQKQKEEATEETTQLDDDWTSIHGLLMPHLRPVVNTKKKDDYDIAVKSLIFEAKAKPTDRLKTDEELAKYVSREHLMLSWLALAHVT